MTNQIILDEAGSSSRRKVISLGTFEGHRYLEIEEYYLDKKSKEWKKKKGVTLNRDSFAVLEGVMARHRERILDWLNVNYVPENVARYDELQASAAETQSKTPTAQQQGTFDGARDPRFFEVTSMGAKDLVSLNVRHAGGKAILGLSPEAIRTVTTILQAFHRARVLLSGTPALDSDVLLNHLEIDWGKFMSALVNDMDKKP